MPYYSFSSGSGSGGTVTSSSLIQNLTLSASVASNALTIAVKTGAGTDPTASDSPIVPFRNSTLATGDYTNLTLTAAVSLVVSSGSTMGFTSAVAGRLWIVGFNDNGTFRLGAVNCYNGTDILAIRNDYLLSSTAEGGGGGADAAHTIYTGTAVTSKAIRILGYMEWSSGLTTAGTWDIVPTKIQLFIQGVSLPGETIQTATSIETTLQAGSTNVPGPDDTIPQVSEVNLMDTVDITFKASANLYRISLFFSCSLSAFNWACIAYFRDSTADALFCRFFVVESANNGKSGSDVTPLLKCGTPLSTTLKWGGAGVSGTFTINGASGLRQGGGSQATCILVEEIMG